MSLGPIDNERINQANPPAGMFEDSTGNHAVDEAVAAYQAAIIQFNIHGNPATIEGVAHAINEISNSVRNSNLTIEQQEILFSKIKTSILDSGLSNLGDPALASEVDTLFGHVLPPNLLDPHAITNLFDESYADSPILAAAGRVDSTAIALMEARRELEENPDNVTLKENVQHLVDRYLNDLHNLHSTIEEYLDTDKAVAIEGLGGLQAALDEITTLLGN